MAKHDGVEPIGSMNALAKLVGRNRATVGRWLKRADWTFGKPPWPKQDVPEILRWASENLRDRIDVEPPGSESTGSSPGKSVAPRNGDGIIELKHAKLEQEVRKLRAQADQAETSLSRERGKLIDASVIEDHWADIGVFIRNGFQNLPSQLTGIALNQGMPIEASAQFQEQVDAAVSAILRRLSGDGRTENNTHSTQTTPGEPVTARAVDAVAVDGKMSSA